MSFELYKIAFVVLPLLFLSRYRQSFITWRSLLLWGIILISLVGFRPNTMGFDTVNYEFFFDNDLFLITESYEHSWVFICMIVKYFLNLPFEAVKLVYAFLGLAPLLFVIKKDSKLPYFSLFLLFVLGYYVISFNIMRQFAACGIGTLALHYLSEKKNLWFVAYSIFAFILHNTAVFLFIIPVLIFFFNRLPQMHLRKYVVFALLSGFLLFGLINQLISFISYEKYSSYTDYAEERGANILNMFIYNVFYVFWALVISNGYNCVYVSKENTLAFYKELLYFKLYIIGLILVSTIGYNIGINRLIYYLQLSFIIAMPYFFYNRKYETYEKSKSNLFIIFSITYYSLYVYSIFFGNPHGIWPEN